LWLIVVSPEQLYVVGGLSRHAVKHGPGRSALLPFKKEILSLWQKRKSARAIAEEMTKHGIQTTPQNMWKFIQRHNVRVGGCYLNIRYDLKQEIFFDPQVPARHADGLGASFLHANILLRRFDSIVSLWIILGLVISIQKISHSLGWMERDSPAFGDDTGALLT